MFFLGVEVYAHASTTPLSETEIPKIPSASGRLHLLLKSIDSYTARSPLFSHSPLLSLPRGFYPPTVPCLASHQKEGNDWRGEREKRQGKASGVCAQTLSGETRGETRNERRMQETRSKKKEEQGERERSFSVARTVREHERGDESLAQSDFVVEERKKKTEEM
eukprot:scaffold84712_cov31-Tisochrysis_lutea.AAC.2